MRKRGLLICSRIYLEIDLLVVSWMIIWTEIASVFVVVALLLFISFSAVLTIHHVFTLVQIECCCPRSVSHALYLIIFHFIYYWLSKKLKFVCCCCFYYFCVLYSRVFDFMLCPFIHSVTCTQPHFGAKLYTHYTLCSINSIFIGFYFSIYFVLSLNKKCSIKYDESKSNKTIIGRIKGIWDLFESHLSIKFISYHFGYHITTIKRYSV